MSVENKEYMNKTDTINEYILTLDRDYFDDIINIDDDIKMLPIRIIKIYSDKEDSIITDTNDKINIIDMDESNYCGYIYEIIIGNM